MKIEELLKSSPESRNEALLMLIAGEKISTDWADLPNAQILSAQFIKEMPDGKKMMRVKLVVNTVEDLPKEEDFSEWHISAGSTAVILHDNKYFIRDTLGNWIERNPDIVFII